MKRKILVIEDNEQNLYLVRFILERSDYEVFAAMDGYAVARSLRENPDLADTPIVAVTSYAMPGDREKTIAAGCNGYIEKPIDPETFVANVERHLPDRKGGEQRR